MLFFTGFSRNSSSILKDQNTQTLKQSADIISNLDYVKELGLEIKKNLIKGDCEEFGKLMHEHWKNKLKRSRKMSNSTIDDIYNFALKNSALGGKLIGAGGGGFLLFYTNNPKRLRIAMKKKKIDEVRFKFDLEGVKQIF